MHYLPFSDALIKRLTTYLEPFLSDPATGSQVAHFTATKLRALPLGYLALNEYFLQPHGPMYTVPWGESVGAPERVSDETWYFAGLRLGSIRFPELVEAIPKAPLAADECARCTGTGLIECEASNLTGPFTVCMQCAGFGWEIRRQRTPN